MAPERVSLIGIQRQLGHTNLGITSIYLQGVDITEIIGTVDAGNPDGARRRDAPNVAASRCRSSSIAAAIARPLRCL